MAWRLSSISEYFVSASCDEVALENAHLSARIRSLLDRVDEAMQVNGRIERRKAALPGADRLGEQCIHLPDIKRITAGEIGRHVGETLRYVEIPQLVASLCTSYAEHLTALRRDLSCSETENRPTPARAELPSNR